MTPALQPLPLGPTKASRTPDGDTRGTIRRVAMGPSLSHWRDILQAELGKEWLVTSLMSQVRSSAPTDVIILGTPEIPVGSVEVAGDGFTAWVLVGTVRSASRRAVLTSSGEREVVQRLVGVVRAAAGQSPSRVRLAA